MSFFEKILGYDSLNNNDALILNWTVDVLKAIEKAGPTLCLAYCGVQIIWGNNVQIQIQDWYDNFIPRFGAEHGLEQFFNLIPADGTSDIYVSKIAPHISCSSKKFISCLEQALNENQISGYIRDNRSDVLKKSFHD